MAAPFTNAPYAYSIPNSVSAPAGGGAGSAGVLMIFEFGT
jgi:hypothetical protein